MKNPGPVFMPVATPITLFFVITGFTGGIDILNPFGKIKLRG